MTEHVTHQERMKAATKGPATCPAAAADLTTCPGLDTVCLSTMWQSVTEACRPRASEKVREERSRR